LLDEVRGGPTGLVLSGEAGIGKTILWQVGVERARGRFAHVLTCRGTQAETALSFAGLSELLGEGLGEAVDSLLPPRRSALEVALLMAELGEVSPDPLAIGLAVRDVLRALAQSGPLLVAVDDVQWFEPGSAGVLEVALRRLREDPTGVFVTSRRTAGAAIPLGLAGSRPEQRLTVLPVGPLSLGGLHHLLGERLGLELSRSEPARVEEASGGNPYFALELGRELVRPEVRALAGRSLQVPESLRDLFGGRLARLPAETADVLLEISAVARPTVQLTADDPGLARRRRVRAAVFYRQAGERERPQAMLEEVLAQAPPGAGRADVLFELAVIRMGEAPAQIALYDRAFADVPEDDARCARLLGFRAQSRLLHSDNVAALADARAAMEKADKVGDPALLATVIGCLGQIEVWAGEVTAGLLERGAELEVREGMVLDYISSPRFWLARLRLRQGQLEEARATFAGLSAQAMARGNEWTRIHVLWYQSILEWFAGSWQLALELAVEAFEAGELAQFHDNDGWRGRVMGLVEADPGLVERARASAKEGIAASEARGADVFCLLCEGVLGRLELALGNVQTAGGFLCELPGRLLASGLNDPTQTAWADAIETLIALGDLEQARDYLEAYEQISRRFTSDWAAASAGRCRGLLSATEGDPEEAFTALDGALTRLTDSPFPLERARTLLCLGTVRRQMLQKRGAREALEQALAIFEELGARLWVEKTRAELARISGRREAGDELTDTEARVAQLAAVGRSNKEIAAELFIGVSTVEGHLSHAYRKLGVRSRAGLAGALGTLEVR
jgi:DNA-binding CsgD family transcriptional regulator